MKLEITYLRLFKTTLLVVMSLVLAAALGLLVYSGILFSAEPKSPPPIKPAEPAKKAEAERVDPELFKKSYLPKNKTETTPPPKAPEIATPSESSRSEPELDYTAEAKELAECTATLSKFLKDGKLLAPERIEGLTASAKRVMERRFSIQSDAKLFSSSFCSTIADSEFLDATARAFQLDQRKDSFYVLNQYDKFYRTQIKQLNSKAQAFENAERKRVEEHDRAERDRVRQFRAAERARVLEAKATAMQMIAAAGVAFLGFMVLALYLIFSSIESNLRNIHHTLKESLEHNGQSSKPENFRDEK